MTTEEKEYKTTREECQKGIDENNNVCPGCGGPLVPFDTVDNSGAPTFWAGCEPCSSFSNGVLPRVFKIASTMVREHNHKAYSGYQFPYNGTDLEKEYFYTSQTRGTCSTVQLILSLNTLLENGRN